MGLGGNRVNAKVCKLSNTYTKKMIEEVLEAHDYKNHNQDEIHNNYIISVCEEVTGEVDWESKRLKKTLSNSEYNQNILKYLKENTEYYGTADSKGRFRKVSKDNVLAREYVFYLPNDEGDRFRADEDLYKAWCDDNMSWFKEHFPSFKVLIACGHFCGETTPHFHVVFLPTSECGKLANNKYFYDHDKDGKKCRTGATIQSDRQQSYINEVLHKYGIEGGIKGSEMTHRDLNCYKSELTHDVRRLEAVREQMNTMELEELDRLYQVEAEHEELKQTLDNFFAQIYNLVPRFVQSLMEKIADRFWGNSNPEIEEEIR